MASRARIAAFAAPAELPALFSRFDVVAVPSLDTPRWSEQFGRVAVEAMAAGVPVVVSDSGALAEVVCGAGALVPQGDVGALAEALRRVSGDAAERQRMGRSGHERAKHYSWAAVASRQAALYRRMSASTLASMDGASPVEVAMESGVRPPARDAEVTE
jgi:glycosyltransferase involved in cell wall biosynthesis